MKYLLITCCLISLILSGCTQKCLISCVSNEFYAAIGYTYHELDSAIINVYTANDSFNVRIESDTLSILDTGINVPRWDLVEDTFRFAYFAKQPGYDIEIIVPSSNRVYRYSKIQFTGSSTENVVCHEGSPDGACTRYLVSYSLNGTVVNFNPYNRGGFLYFQK